MAIIPQKTLFQWEELESLGDLERLRLVIEHLPDEDLMLHLENDRKNRRDDYPIRAMWNALLAGVVFGHPSIESLRRELARNAQLRIMCGFKFARGDTGEPGATGGKRMGILSAAVKVLEEYDGSEPLKCQQMVEQMMAKGYWAPRRNNLTPPATLYSGIIREIREKDDNSRFKKNARGRFVLNR